MKTKGRVSWALVGVVILTLVSVFLVFPQTLVFPAIKEPVQNLNIKLGLDLSGGARLEYEADTSKLAPDQVASAMDSVQGVVERRVNAIGVGEPKVQQAISGDSHRIIVEIPGVNDIRDAKDKIKDAPFLEFRERPDENPEAQEMVESMNEGSRMSAEESLRKALEGEDFSELAKNESQDPTTAESGGDLGFVSETIFGSSFDEAIFDEKFAVGTVRDALIETEYGWHIVKKEEERFVKDQDGTEEVVEAGVDGATRQVRVRHIYFPKRTVEELEYYAPQLVYTETGLTGQYLKSATVDTQGQQYGLSEIAVAIHFNDEGAKMFEEITKRNVGKPLAIFIDGELVTAPTVNEPIAGGTAVITGGYTLDEAKDLAKRLNEGALPVPLTLVGESIVSPTLGAEELAKSVQAGLVGLMVVAVYIIVYYRLPGVVASFALILYSLIMISIFKLSGLGGSQFQITLTLSGIAGFILSIGMAIDANVLIFERMKEELRLGKALRIATKEGFKRAWTSIWDGNLSTLITCVILIGVGTGFVKGFALILALGVMVSMFSAMFVTRVILLALPLERLEKYHFLFLGKDTKSA